MKLLKDMTNEEIVNELIYEVETTSKLSESNYFAMVKEELLSRLSNWVANNVINPTSKYLAGYHNVMSMLHHVVRLRSTWMNHGRKEYAYFANKKEMV